MRYYDGPFSEEDIVGDEPVVEELTADDLAALQECCEVAEGYESQYTERIRQAREASS